MVLREMVANIYLFQVFERRFSHPCSSQLDMPFPTLLWVCHGNARVGWLL